jgi:hypothetical protein
VLPAAAVVVQLVHVPGRVQVIDVLLAVVLGRVPVQRAGGCGQVGSSVRAQRQVAAARAAEFEPGKSPLVSASGLLTQNTR